MEETLIRVLIRALICESCYSPMYPPLIQCHYGHLECSECIEISDKCFTCFSILSRRNYFLERLCFRTALKCSFAKKGCPFSGKALEVAYHEDFCTFGANTNQSSYSEKVDCGKNIEESQSTQRADAGKDSPGEFLEEVVASALECPVCYTRILPSVLECSNGHQICFGCNRQTRECPLCRCPEQAHYNKFLGQIFERLQIRCINANSGCQVRRKGLSITFHEISCEFAFRPCPLDRFRCRWNGFKSDYVDHCMREHADIICLESESRWEFNHRCRPVFNLLYVDGVMFRSAWRRYGLLRGFSVTYIEDKRNVTSYTFDLKIIKPGSDDGYEVFSGKCFPVRNFFHRTVAAIYVEQESILDFCDSNGTISYILKINKCSNVSNSSLSSFLFHQLRKLLIVS